MVEKTSIALTIDDIRVTVPAGMTILNAAKVAGISIPTLCYLEGINDIGACRVCLVEIEGRRQLFAACNNAVEEGMVVYTNSRTVREARRINVEMILSQHSCQCPSCARSGNCSLQTIANDLGILTIPYEKQLEEAPWNLDYPLVRDSSKCIKCMRCVQVCNRIQTSHIWDVSGSGCLTTIGVSGNRKIEEAGCALCGQCITHCPVGTLQERDDTDRAFKALSDPEIVTIVEVAPAVRTAWGESLGLTREEATVGRMVSALKKMGFDYVLDTSFTADLTIMEEGSEFLRRLSDGKEHKTPLFTSCCPGWVRFAKSRYPELIPELSTAKSPQQMFGAIAKSYMAEKIGVKPEKIRCISIMPCLAKKYECAVPEVNSAGAAWDVDMVLTTREFDRMIREAPMAVTALPETEFDEILGEGTGAGIIFGTSGGVMEAALRTAYYFVVGENPDPGIFSAVRGREGWREADFELSGKVIRIAVASGLKNARNLIEAVKKGEVSYDFVEIMACPGGCAGGGGQPIHDRQDMARTRGDNLYGMDSGSAIRYSHENPKIKLVYSEYLETPLSKRSHELLHTEHSLWDLDLWRHVK